MSLETGTYISDLVATNPTSSDPKSAGDDHLRLLKSTIKTTFPNVSGAVTPTHTELNFVDGVTSAIQGQIDSKGAIAGQTWTGAHDFTTGTMTVATPTLGTHPTTKAYADALAFSSALPGQAGNSGKFVTTDGSTASWAEVYPLQTGNSGKFLSTNGTATSWASVTPPQIVRSDRTSNTILGVADSQKIIDITSGTFTQTFDAVATLGNGWFVYLRNSGTGDITLDPNSSELIDGLTSYVMYPGETRIVQCDGAALTSVVVQGFSKTFTASGTFTKPPGYQKFEGLIWSGGNSGVRSGNTTYAQGGGGGGCFPFLFSASAVSATTSVTVGAGGAGKTTGGYNLGGTSSFGSLCTVSAYSLGGQLGHIGGAVQIAAGVVAGTTGSTFSDGFARGSNGSYLVSSTIYGGASGSDLAASDSGSSIYGGACGGCVDGSGVTYLPGTSKQGGNGGAAGDATSGAAGTAPGGGGGATRTGTTSGAGARGEVRIYGVA